MNQIFHIHPDNPQPRLISRAVDTLNKGGVIVYPTDSGYALGCRLEDKTPWSVSVAFVSWTAATTSRWFVAISELSTYAHVDNSAFRLIKTIRPAATPLF